MWLLRQCLDEWEATGTYIFDEALSQRVRSLPAPEVLIDVDAPELMVPGVSLRKNQRSAQAKRRDEQSVWIPRGFRRLRIRFFTVWRSVTRSDFDPLPTIDEESVAAIVHCRRGKPECAFESLDAECTGLEVIRARRRAPRLEILQFSSAALTENGRRMDRSFRRRRWQSGRSDYAARRGLTW